MCRNKDEFMASLPFPTFKVVNAQDTLPPCHRNNLAIRDALTEALDFLMDHQIRLYMKRSDILNGLLIVKLCGIPLHSTLR